MPWIIPTTMKNTRSSMENTGGFQLKTYSTGYNAKRAASNVNETRILHQNQLDVIVEIS